MKTLIIVAVATVVGLAALSTIFLGDEVTYVKEREVATTTEEIVVEEVDVIQAARAELERINKELDLEEQKLLEEQAAITARLDEIRETRMSF